MPVSDKRGTTGHTIGPETFRFFRELGRNNSKAWMDANRERYQSAVVEPMRGLLTQLTPAALRLYPGFDLCGRTGVNFSRINRDIRFAKDKRPYRPQMYVIFPDGANMGLGAETGIQEGFLPPQHVQQQHVLRTPFAQREGKRRGNVPRRAGLGMTTLGVRGGNSRPRAGGESRRPGELYVGVSAKLVTAGYRVYFDGKTKAAALGARTAQAPKWCARQKRRIGRKFESYWYSVEKGGAWTKNNGWPVTPEEWKKLKAWVVRRKLAPAAASRKSFAKDAEKIFRDVMPLFRFVGQ
jgi:hypothetical protein